MFPLDVLGVQKTGRTHAVISPDVVHQQIHAAELPGGAVHEGGGALGPAQVRRHRERSRLLKGRCDRAGGAHGMDPLTGECAHHGHPDASAGARDDGPPVREVKIHGVPVISRFVTERVCGAAALRTGQGCGACPRQR
ncbi:hypothetical protein GCM10010327_18080 [Streptomyces nitrosporeus]|nr:hypothetical protein GCM10010327_18080 [Streptomyces nitrosporeus]